MIWFSQVTCWYTKKVWFGKVKSLYKPFCICELWDLENIRLYLLVISGTSCNWGYKWEFVCFFLLPLPSLLLPHSSLIHPPASPSPPCFPASLLCFSTFPFPLTPSSHSFLSVPHSPQCYGKLVFFLEALTGLKTPLSKLWETEKGGNWHYFTFSF